MSAAAQVSIDSVPLLPSSISSRSATLFAIAAADLTAILLSSLAAVLVLLLFGQRVDMAATAIITPAVAMAPLIFMALGLYPGVGTHPVIEFQSILKACGLTLMLVVCSAFVFHAPINFSRFLVFITWCFGSILLSASRNVVRRAFCARPWWGVPTAIIGDEAPVREMCLSLQRNREAGLRPIALLTPATVSVIHDNQVDGPISASIAAAPLIARSIPGCYAIVIPPASAGAFPVEFVSQYARGFSHVFVVPHLAGLASLWVRSKEIAGVLGIEVNQSLEQVAATRLKRAFDLVISSGLLLCLAPLFGLVYLAILLTSGRPVFFSHTRIGLNGKPFQAWKFRSMVPNAATVLERHLAQSEALRAEWLAEHKLKLDPRVTAIGHLLRRSSLDELPQIWNVFRGQMSLVGPRPIVAEEVAKYGERYDSYLRVKPGITGLWQVSGRNNTTYIERVRLDAYYVRNWSVWLDIYILYHSVKTVLLAEGAC